MIIVIFLFTKSSILEANLVMIGAEKTQHNHDDAVSFMHTVTDELLTSVPIFYGEFYAVAIGYRKK